MNVYVSSAIKKAVSAAISSVRTGTLKAGDTFTRTEGVEVHKDGKGYLGEVSVKIHLFHEYKDEGEEGEEGRVPREWTVQTTWGMSSSTTTDTLEISMTKNENKTTQEKE